MRGDGYSRSESVAVSVVDDDGDPVPFETRDPYYNPRQDPDNEMAQHYKISVVETVTFR